MRGPTDAMRGPSRRRRRTGAAVPAVAALLAALVMSLLLSYPSSSHAELRTTERDLAAGDDPAEVQDGAAEGAVRADEPSVDAPFRVQVGDRALELDLESLFVLPGGVRYVDAQPAPDARLDATGGTVERVGPGEWRWTAPEAPGDIERLTVRSDGDSVRLHAFVLVPRVAKEGGRLEGYRIGAYPAEPLRGNPVYDRPRGFVKVTAENEDTHVSPRFQLRHFPAKQGTDFPKFVVLRPKLLTKLEVIADALADRGYPVRSLHVMSGYRTPYYNGRLGNVRYSRHQWGGAADIFVDERPRDGRMDDLNEDGRSDVRDARILYQVVDSLDQDFRTEQLLGGLGLYRANRVRGPFVHVDVRGEIARW